MLCYKDKTFCASPNCKNECNRKMSIGEIADLIGNDMPIAWGYFCGEPTTRSSENDISMVPSNNATN